MVHTSMSLVLPCWSSRVGAAVGSLIHTLNCILVWLPLWTLVGKMPFYPQLKHGPHATAFCPTLFLYGGGGTERGD
jgi:hypothetical protein